MQKLSLSLFFRNLNNLNLQQQLKHNSICPQLKLSNLIKMVIHQIKQQLICLNFRERRFRGHPAKALCLTIK